MSPLGSSGSTASRDVYEAIESRDLNRDTIRTLFFLRVEIMRLDQLIEETTRQEDRPRLFVYVQSKNFLEELRQRLLG